jgi:hypothetical protein
LDIQMGDTTLTISRYLLLIGAMKSGTTTLFNYLVQHPAIAGADFKESAFFAFDDTFARGRAWYDGLFNFDPKAHRWALDGSTDYTKSPFCDDVRARMATFENAEFRMVYMMRHPLRRIESHAQHVQVVRRELGRSFSPRPDHSLDAGISPVSLAASSYATQLDRFRDQFDAGRVKLLTLEEFSNDPERCVNEVFAFLGLDPLPALAQPQHENRYDKRRHRAPMWRKVMAIPGISRVARVMTPTSFRHAVDRATRIKVEAKGRFKLTPEEEAELLVQLRPDLIRLRDVYGIDVEGQWGIDLRDPKAVSMRSAVGG